MQLITGDCRSVLPTLPSNSFQMCVSSPPYFNLRDYGVAGQIGMEASPEEYVRTQVEDVFRGVRRVLHDTATLWVNMGDVYIDKQLMMIPAMFALGMKADGWYLISQIAWHKPNPMPEPVKHRPTSAWEAVFLFSKSDRYYYDGDAIATESKYPEIDCGFRTTYHKRYPTEKVNGIRRGGVYPMANARNVWTIPVEPSNESHFAVMPRKLAENCIKAGSRRGDKILDPFGGAGTTGVVAKALGRDATLIELNPAYVTIAERRISRVESGYEWFEFPGS